MSTPGSNVPAGWYPDPTMANTQRYWDGSQWTHNVQPISDQPPPSEPYAPQQDPTQHQPTQQYPAGSAPVQAYPGNPYQPQDHAGPQQFTPAAPGPMPPPRSGMSTGFKVLIAIGVLSLLMLGGCAALISLAASSGPSVMSDAGETGSAEPATALAEDDSAEPPSDAEQPLLDDTNADQADGAQSGADSSNAGRLDGDTAGGGSATLGTRADPLPFDQAIDITWTSFGDADGSTWTTRIGPLRDITDDVLSENQFNSEPPDGVRFAGFEVELTLVEAAKEPLAPGFNFSWEVLGGSTAAAYQLGTIETDSFGCGLVPGAFDDFSEVFVTGSLTGTVCIPIPEEDMNHPDTRVAIHFIDDSRAIFGN